MSIQNLSELSVEETADSLRRLKELNAERYDLKLEPLSHPLLDGTFLKERDAVIPYGLDGFNKQNAVVFTGQCLLKHDEDPECPVTLEDMLEILKLRDFLQKTQLPAVCMIPDSIYLDKKFLDPWFGGHTDLKEIRERVEKFADLYTNVRRKLTPSVKHIRTSEIEEKLNGARNRLSLPLLIPKIRQVYGGRFLKNKEHTHPLSQTILEYGMVSLILRDRAGYTNREHIIVFSEPDEICSVKATELILAERGDRLRANNVKSVGLIGQIPLPPLYYPPDLEKNRMYGAPRKSRIHVNEPDENIRGKLLENPSFALLAVYMSPATDQDELDYLRVYGTKGDVADILIGQIRDFRRYL